MLTILCKRKKIEKQKSKLDKKKKKEEKDD